MYSKFELDIQEPFHNNELNKHLESGKKIYSKHKEEAKKNLKEFIYNNGNIDGTSMKNNWFQIEKVDIFISHSHQDINKVQAFAGWLYDQFELTAFIDSCVWGYCDELLKQLDDKYCKNKTNENYNYDLRNYTTSHVHIMLSTALAAMIDKTECIMFYNTPNAILLSNDLNEIKSEKKKVTLSPWIYYELAMTSLIRKYKPNREHLLEHASRYKQHSERNTINIEYKVEEYLKDMIKITDEQLIEWKRYYQVITHKLDGDNIPYISGKEDTHPLDVLYDHLWRGRQK